MAAFPRRNTLALQQSNSVPDTGPDLQALPYKKSLISSVCVREGLPIYFILFFFLVKKIFSHWVRPGMIWILNLELSFS